MTEVNLLAMNRIDNLLVSVHLPPISVRNAEPVATLIQLPSCNSVAAADDIVRSPAMFFLLLLQQHLAGR